MSKQIPVKGKHGVSAHALVDDEDYERFVTYSWHLDPANHPRRNASVPGGGTKSFGLCREVVGQGSHPQQLHHTNVRHRNGNPLDCRRDNLYVVSIMPKPKRTTRQRPPLKPLEVA